MSRNATLERNTKETKIQVSLNLDEPGDIAITSGIGFFDHLLDLFAKHGNFSLKVTAKGDLEVDGHHTVEDIGIVIGQAFEKAIGDKRGIVRFASLRVPLDESLSEAVLDIGGRPFLFYDVPATSALVGEFDTSLAHEFWRAFTDNAKVNLHLQNIRGTNAHHQLETIFKAAGRAIRAAIRIDPAERGVPSTKGVL